MRKVTRLESLPPDDSLLSGAHEIFSLQRFKPSSTSTAWDMTAATQDKSASTRSTLMPPAVDAVEKLASELAKAAGKMAQPG